MTKQKTTKRSLIMSGLALLICVSMLIGSTFAWFTDSVTSGGNIIKSGTLDVTMEWADGTKAVPADDSNVWTDASTGPIFESKLWEPGYTEVRHIKIANEGTLALKYQLNIIANGQVSELADVIDVYYLDPASQIADRAALNALTADKKLGTLTDVLAKISTTASGNLAAGEKDTITIALKMQESAGNKYQDLSIGSDFSIQLLATQLTAENDSFDDQYDKDADYEGEVSNAASLAAALKNGGTYKVVNDIALNSALTVAEGVTVNLDLNGKTLSGDIIAPNANLTVINGNITDNTAEGSGIEINAGTLYLEKVNITSARHAVRIDGGVTATINGGTYKVTGEYAMTTHALNVSGNAAVTVNGGTFIGIKGTPNGAAMGGSAVNVQSGATVTINGGDFSGGVNDTLASNGTLIVKGGTFDQDPGKYVASGYAAIANANGTYTVSMTQESLSDALKNAASGDTITMSAGEFSLPSLADKEGLTIEGVEGTVIGGENASTGFGGNFGKDTTIKNITFSGSSNGVRYSYAKGGNTTFENCTFAGDSVYGFHIDESNGATFTFNNCTFVGFNAFAGDLAKVVFNNCTFLSNGNYGHTNIWSIGEFNNCTWGDNTSVSPGSGGGTLYFNNVEESYHHEFIGSAESLVAFADSVNNGGDSWSGQKVLLVADIDLNNAPWTPIGQTGATEFKGTFDGQGNTISNLTVDSTAQTGGYYSSGLFGWIESHGNQNITIKNVNVDGATVSGHHNVAVIAGYLEGGAVIENCHVTNATLVNTHANDDACGDKTGVIAGYVAGEVTVKNCSAADSTVAGGRDVGQLLGASYATPVDCRATNVTVSATGDCTGANIVNDLVGRKLA